MTATPTATPTTTPTTTPTATPTLAPDGAACSDPAQCVSGFCANSVCCNTACDQPFERCDIPGNEGVCSSITNAPAPALSSRALLLGLAAMFLVGLLAIARARRHA